MYEPTPDPDEYRATVTYFGTLNGRTFPFTITLFADDSQELEAEILQTLAELQDEGFEGRVCYI